MSQIVESFNSALSERTPAQLVTLGVLSALGVSYAASVWRSRDGKIQAYARKLRPLYNLHL